MEIVYRILNSDNVHSLNENKPIRAKRPLNPNTKLKEAMKQVNTHLQKGTMIDSCWISCSTDFIRDIELYGVTRNGIDIIRKPIAWIQNHAQSQITLQNSKPYYLEHILHSQPILKEYSINQIAKLVYNLTNRSHGKKLGNYGFILTKDERPCNNNVLSLSYAGYSKEVIVLNQIPASDVIAVFSPFETDLLYATMKENLEQETNLLLEQLLTDHCNGNLNYFILTSLQQLLWMDLYQNKKQIHHIAYELWQQHQYCDILSIYQSLLDQKGAMIQQVLSAFGVFLKNVPIVENTLEVVRIGSSTQIGAGFITYNGNMLPIRPLIHHQEAEIHNTKRVCLVVKQENANDGNYSILTNGIIIDNACLLEKDIVKIKTLTR